MADDLEDLDEAVRRHDPDRWLATRFITDPQARADVIALYAFNHEIARVAGAVSDPMMGEIRLTWWAEALSEIYEDRTVRRHPVSLALLGAIRRHDLRREPFDALIEARYPELYGEPLDPEATEVPLMTLAAWVLGAPSSPAFTAAVHGRYAEADKALRTYPAAGFPAVAHIALRRHPSASILKRRLRITWAVLTGRL